MGTWQKLPPDAQQLLLTKRKVLELNRGERVYQAGDRPNGMYLVESGLVGLVAISDKGSEHLLRLFKAGDFFGHRSWFAKEPYHATATALSPVVLSWFSGEAVELVLERFPQVQRLVIERLARELGDAEQQRLYLTEKDVLSRVARAVVYLKELHPSHVWTRQEIANFCASTAPSVIRALAALEDRGWIAQSGRSIEILDREGLLQAAVDDESHF